MKHLMIIEKQPDDSKETLDISRERLVYLPPTKICNYPMVERRDFGNFKDYAFFLGGSFDWILGLDNEGETILVPLKKR